MSCPYYWWNNHYACRKSGKDVNEDIYYKYCRGYDYSDCPIYKGNSDSSSGGWCYLTTACVETMGLPDNCHELCAMRALRDGYIRKLPEGDAEICDYYFTAPQIIEAINNGGEPEKVFSAIYEELVKPCVEAVDSDNFPEAYEHYKLYTAALKDKYLK